MSLVQFLRILFARRMIFLTALISCVVVALIMSQILPRRYEATARVMLEATKPDPVTGLSMGNMFRVYATTQLELIQGYEVAGLTVDKLGWANEPTIMDNYASATDGQGADIRRWLAQQIIDTTKARIVEPSNILEITYSAPEPETARKIVETVRDAYLETSLNIRRDGARKNAKWFREQADKAKAILTQAEEERSAFAKANGIVIQPDNSDIEASKLSTLSAQSAAAASTPQLPIVTPGAPPPVMGGATLQLEAVNQQLAQASQTLGPNHPSYQALLRQKSVLESEAAKQRQAANSQQPTIKMPSPQAAINQVNAAYAAQKARVVAQRDKVDKLNQMRADIEVKRAQYVKAEEKAADLNLEASVGDAGITPMGESSVPEKPTFPNVPLILGGAVGFGSALGVCLSLLIELLARRVRSDEDLEYAAKAPVFAIIGQADAGNDSWYRRLGRRLQRWTAERRARKLGMAA